MAKRVDQQHRQFNVVHLVSQLSSVIAKADLLLVQEIIGHFLVDGDLLVVLQLMVINETTIMGKVAFALFMGVRGHSGVGRRKSASRYSKIHFEHLLCPTQSRQRV